MKREHKYKAWDKTHNEWYMDGTVFDLDYSGKYGDFYFNNDNPHDMRSVELEWLQAIGRKDKNDVMIFDGDIVRDGVDRIWIVDYSDKLCAFVFRYSKNQVNFRYYNNFTDMQLPLEIISNIKQNPELLERE